MREQFRVSRTAVFVVTAMVSGVTSTLGINDTLWGTGGGVWLAVLLGFATFALIFFVWEFFTAAMERANRSQMLSGLLFLPFLLAAIFLLSSWYNAAAIVGSDA